MRQRTARCAAASLAAALAFTACIPDTERDAAPVRAASPVAGARPGGRIIVAAPDPGAIDPGNAVSPSARRAVGLICDTLVSIDPRTGAATPAIARSWTIADRGRKLFLRLRRDVRFHNGRALVAEDVAWTLTRLASEDFASDVASLMKPVAGYDIVHGDTETDDDRFRRRLAGIAIIDPHNLEITLAGPYADWVKTLAHPATAPLPREEVERNSAAFAAKPSCTGPYRVAEPFASGKPLKLRRADGYYAANHAYTRGGRGWADEIELHPYATRADEQRAVEEGRADVAARGEGAPPASGSVRQIVANTSQVEFIGLPTTTPPFDDPGVRTALAVALDREAIGRAVYDGARAPALSFVPEALGAAHRTAVCPELRSTSDTDRARTLLRATGIDLRGKRLMLYFNDEHRNRKLVDAVAAAWSFAFGLKVEPVALPWGRFVELGTRPSGFRGAFRYGWAPPVATPDAMLSPLFHTDSIGRDNLSLFGLRDFDDAVLSARRTALESDRLRDYRRAEDLVCRQMPMIPVVVAQRRVLLSSRLGSAIAADPVAKLDGEPVLRELYVAG